MRKVKVLILIQSFNMGGAEHLSLIISEYLLTTATVVPVVCALEHSGPLRARLVAAGIRTLDVGKKPGIDLSVPFRLSKLIRDEMIDVVHAHNLGPLLYGFPASCMRVRRPHFIYSEHVRLEQEVQSKSLLMAQRFLAKKVDLFLGIAQHISDYAHERLGVPKTRVFTIPNGINLQRHSSVAPAPDLLALKQSGDLLICCVAALRPQKDHETLIRSMIRVAASIPTARLLLIGDGPCRNDLERLTRELGLESHVNFAGYRSDIPAVLAACDVVALSSRYEGLSLSALEGMAAGRAVVLTDVFGNSEIIEKGQTGLLVPAGAPEEMAIALVSLLENRSLRERLGVAARRSVEKRYDVNTMLTAYARLYESFA